MQSPFKYASNVVLSVTASLYLLSGTAHAQLEAIEETGTNVFDAIDAAAIILIAISFIVAGIGYTWGWVRPETAAKIAAGGVIAGGALELAGFFYGIL